LHLRKLGILIFVLPLVAPDQGRFDLVSLQKSGMEKIDRWVDNVIGLCLDEVLDERNASILRASGRSDAGVCARVGEFGP